MHRLDKRSLQHINPALPCVPFVPFVSCVMTVVVDPPIQVALGEIDHSYNVVEAFKTLSPDVQRCIEVATRAVMEYGGVFPHLPKKLRANKKLALRGVHHGGDFIQHVSSKLQHDMDVFEAAV